MNFFDTWDIARASTPQPPTNDVAQQAQQPSLNEEVNEVIGQLGRFWGGFRAQSQKVLETAKKDFGDVVIQAQKEIGKLSASAPPTEGEPSTRSDPISAPSSSESTTGGDKTTKDSESGSDSVDPSTPTASTSSGTLFSRLQAALPPNLVATVQSHIPESIKHASENVDLNQIRSNLVAEFQRVQGITRAQAEEYAHKGEAYLREVVKEANEVLKDAVKIIPPSPTQEQSGLVWDGTDMWMLPTTEASASGSGGNGSSAGPSRQVGEMQTAVASRALALLARLQSDPTILQHDPEAEDAVKDQYRKWLQDEVESKGGIDGPEWSEKSAALLKENTSLYEMYTSLVSAELSKEDFWQRYFFRAHQIKTEEERRKALLQATTESDEDFSWEGSDSEEEEDDDEEEGSDTDTSSKASAPVPPVGKTTLSPKDATTSGRPSSEESYDVVSSTNASIAGEPSKKQASTTDDSDSDWE